MSNKTGGPAFPHMIECVGDNLYRPITEGGMTLRDYFAAKAMQSLAKNINGYCNEKYINGLAQTSYWVADAMLKAKGEKE